MLPKKITTLILFALVLFSFELEANYKKINGIVYSLNEFALLNLPHNNSTDWKGISRATELTNGMVEWIPCNQTKDNFSEIIAIQYFEKSILDKDLRNSMENIVENIRKKSLTAFPKNSVSFKILEEKKNDILYEVLHQEYKDSPKEHEISHIFFTKRGVHRIGISQRYSEMNSTKREECIKVLKEVSIVTAKEAAKSDGFSIVDKIKDSLDIGPKFNDWTLVNVNTKSNGYYEVVRIAPGHNENCITELFEVVTTPIYGITIDQCVEIQKTLYENRFSQKLQFNNLTKSPTESFYNFYIKVDNTFINFVVKTLISKHGYYCIVYKIALLEKLPDEAIHYWKEQLDAVKIKTSPTE